MQAAEIVQAAIPFLIALLILIAVWAVVELALTIRKARSTVDEANKIVEQASPLVEHATLTVDALNLELMRVDSILEDVEQVTDAATNAANVVNSVSSAPVHLAQSLADRLRVGAKSRSRTHAAQLAADKNAAANEALASGGEQATEQPDEVSEPAHRPGSTAGVTVIEQAPKDSAAATDGETV